LKWDRSKLNLISSGYNLDELNKIESIALRARMAQKNKNKNSVAAVAK